VKEISLQTIVRHFEKHNWEIHIYEPGEDSDKVVIASDWNDIPDAMYNYLENFYHLDWSDECTGCSECNAHIHLTPSHYGDIGNHIITEYGYVCRKCVEDNQVAYLEDFINWSDSTVQNRAIKYFQKPALEEAGFVEFHSINSICKDVYETGFHAGQNDDPVSVAKMIHETLGLVEIVFCNDGVGQFDCRWSVYVRLNP
jgi:hypothetical protein